MFNRKASKPKNKTHKILENLNLRPGQKIADIGAGGGYFTLRFAEKVGKEGQVFAVDTHLHFLNYIQKEAHRKGLENITCILAQENGFTLPEKVNLIFMRNVCHHLPNRVEYFQGLKKLLKTEGKIALIEYNKNKHFSRQEMNGHWVPKQKLMKEMEQAGYHLLQELDFLPEQSFTIYSW